MYLRNTLYTHPTIDSTLATMPRYLELVRSLSRCFFSFVCFQSLKNIRAPLIAPSRQWIRFLFSSKNLPLKTVNSCTGLLYFHFCKMTPLEKFHLPAFYPFRNAHYYCWQSIREETKHRVASSPSLPAVSTVFIPFYYYFPKGIEYFWYCPCSSGMKWTCCALT